MEELKKEIEKILFELLQGIQMYQIDKGYTIFEADYSKYSQKIIDLIKEKTDHISDPSNQ